MMFAVKGGSECCTGQTIFSCLDKEDLARRRAGWASHRYHPGATLYYEGNPALAVHFISEGTVKLWRAGHGGDEHLVALRRRGALIGCRAVLAGTPYQTTAEALERTVACTIDRGDFLSALGDSSALCLSLLTRLAKETLETEEHLVSLTLARVLGRTARYLLSLIPETTPPDGLVKVQLPLSRIELAHLVGTTPETLSRTLRVLVERGIIESQGRMIVVTDSTSLRRLSA